MSPPDDLTILCVSLTWCLPFLVAQDYSPSPTMSSKEFSLQEVSGHNTKKDLYMVIHDKVYDASGFVDEHPYVFRGC